MCQPLHQVEVSYGHGLLPVDAVQMLSDGQCSDCMLGTQDEGTLH